MVRGITVEGQEQVIAFVHARAEYPMKRDQKVSATTIAEYLGVELDAARDLMVKLNVVGRIRFVYGPHGDFTGAYLTAVAS